MKSGILAVLLFLAASCQAVAGEWLDSIHYKVDIQASLSDGEYEARLSDFCNYVYSEEDGLQTDCPDLTVGSVVYDPVSCPLPVQSVN